MASQQRNPKSTTLAWKHIKRGPCLSTLQVFRHTFIYEQARPRLCGRPYLFSSYMTSLRRNFEALIE